jgi:hypothetical protein
MLIVALHSLIFHLICLAAFLPHSLEDGHCQGGAKRLEAAAQAEEMVAIVNDGLPGWQDGLGELGLALAVRFLCFCFFAAVLCIF